MDWNEVLAETLQKIPGGLFILAVIAGIIVLLPVYKDIHEMMMKRKEDRAKKIEAANKKLEDEIKFKKDVSEAISHLPKLNERIDTLSDDVKDIAEKVARLEKVSTDTDTGLGKSIKQTQEMIEGVGEKVNVIISGDLDEFRAYLLQLHTDVFIKHDREIDANEVETLRIRYKKYKREGGNGWAERMFYDLFSAKVSDGRTVGEIVEELDEGERLAEEEAAKPAES